jgi:leucyl aminopeptidase
MSKTKLAVKSAPSAATLTSVVILGSYPGQSSTELSPKSAVNLDKNALKLLGATGKIEDSVRTVLAAGTAVGVVGLGSNSPSPEDLRKVGGVIARKFSDFKSVEIQIPVASAEHAIALLEGVAIGNYDYTKYKSKPKVSELKTATLVSNVAVSAAALKRAGVLADSVHEIRNLVNQPALDLFPAAFAAHAVKTAKDLELKVQVWDEKQLAKQGFGGLAAVGAGSTRPPRLVRLEYSGKGAKKHIALVGKGITFDSGGLSLKPADSMVGMKYDMTGAASVYQALVAIASLKLPVKVTAWLCLAENLPSGSATRPSDVIRAKNGKTIEVLNTDAEGRLVLADGLSAASAEFPDLIVDVATLTGAATIALGNRYAGLMGSDEAVSAVEAAAFDAGELVWHMPLPVELRSLLDSPIADIANAKIGNRAGGMLLGGLFLQDFIGPDKAGNPIPWAHLDIAGPANNDGAPYGYIPKGSTGTILRTLVSLAEAYTV